MEHVDPAQELPFTVESLADDLRSLGVGSGSTLLVHSSLSSLGYVAGGAHAVVLALLDVLGPAGTLVVPAHSSDLSDPGHWENPPVPEAWWPVIRASAPAFDRDLTATRGMGAIADTVRRVPAALRSAHPTDSICAVGPGAARLTAVHRLEDGLGESSPLARLYESGADVLLLGVGHANNTSLHLAEVRAGTQPATTDGAPVLVDGERAWVAYPVTAVDTDDFDVVGGAVGEAGIERVGTVGRATARLMPMRNLVDFATGWFAEHRTAAP